MSHSGNHLVFGVGAEICSQHHRVVRKTEDQNDGKQTVRAAEKPLHSGQLHLPYPALINNLGVKIEPCKWVSTRENKGRIEVQSKRATLRSDPTQTVR